MKKILLVSGHTSGHNKCAATGVNEGDLNIELVKKIVPLLARYAQVTVYPYERDMYKDNKAGCCKVNMSDFDYIFEVHFNAGGGRGTSIQIHSAYKDGISVEQTVVNRVTAIGFKKRGDNGIVRRSDLLNMNLALKKGIDYALIETCFYDSASDMATYKANKDAVANAIASGIIDAFGLTAKTNGNANSGNFAVVSNCSRLNVRETPNGSVIGTVKVGVKLELLGTGKDSDGDTWQKVKPVDSRLEGYVWPKYITKL